MGRMKELFSDMREDDLHDRYLDDEYQEQEWRSRERVSSKTQTSIILNELFSSFGEIFSASESLKGKMK